MDKQVTNRKPIVIGVCGGTASGKTTFAEKIRDMLLSTGHKTVMISQDSFYRNLNEEQLALAEHNNYNFDHPDAIDFAAMCQVLRTLIEKGTSQGPSSSPEDAANGEVDVPIYDFVTHQRSSEFLKVQSGDSIILEGLFIFSDPELRSLLDIKLFVDVDDDTRLARRVRRDISSRGRDIVQVLDGYEKYVKPGYRFFIEPYKRYADIIVPYGGHNEIAVVMISQYLRRVAPSNSSLTTSTSTTQK